MNRYGAMAWDHWERHRPVTVASIPDPVSYFTELGAFVEAEVTTETQLRLDPLEATDPDRVAQVRREVEEELLPVHVLLAAENDPEPDPAPDPDLVEVLELPVDSPTLERWRRSPLTDPGPEAPPTR
jgi:hypothetical protein